MFKIDSEKEFISFLKILAEESVVKSRRILETSDHEADSFKERLKKEKELYEAEEDEEDTGQMALDTGEDEDEEEDLLAGAAEEAAEEEENTGEKEAQPDDEEENSELRASLDALERNINALRAGRSLRDSSVESQLEIYFDRLGDDEKSLMVLFIRELSKILSGEISGDAAVDPNDDPYNLDVIQGEDEPAEEESPDQSVEPTEQEEDDMSATADEPQEEEEEEEEDTSPPISVGEPQNIAEIRKRIRKLMSA